MKTTNSPRTDPAGAADAVNALLRPHEAEILDAVDDAIYAGCPLDQVVVVFYHASSGTLTEARKRYPEDGTHDLGADGFLVVTDRKHLAPELALRGQRRLAADVAAYVGARDEVSLLAFARLAGRPEIAWTVQVPIAQKACPDHAAGSA